jgi:hypothetical protein
MELGTPSRTKASVPDPFKRLMIDVSVLGDTLKTADRLEAHRLQREVPVQPIVETIPPPSDLAAIIPDSRAVGRGKKSVVRKLKPKPKYTTRQTSA